MGVHVLAFRMTSAIRRGKQLYHCNTCTPKAVPTLATIVAGNGDKFCDSRRFGRQSPKSATIVAGVDRAQVNKCSGHTVMNYAW